MNDPEDEISEEERRRIHEEFERDPLAWKWLIYHPWMEPAWLALFFLGGVATATVVTHVLRG